MARPKQVQSSDAEAQEQLAQAAHEELPEPGHERREAIKRRQATLEEQIERLAQKMQRGTIDSKELEIVNEIANKTAYLNVSNQRSDYVYGWVSKNRHGQHMQRARAEGWEVVDGDDQEGIELKGVHDNSTLRSLGDVVLMRIKRDIYIALKAREQVRTKEVQQNSAGTLVEMGHRYRDLGVKVYPYRMDTMEGPEIKAHTASLDAALRSGTVPGLNIPS